MVAHRGEKRVSFVKATAQTKEKWTKNTVGYKLRDRVSDVSGAKLSALQKSEELHQ
jgi:hypothetical protein